MRWRIGKLLIGASGLVLLGGGPAAAQGKLRNEVEGELRGAEAAFRAAPNDASARRAYGRVLYQLGNVWQASETIAPLATRAAADTADLGLGARLAYLTGDYGRAERLYRRLAAAAPAGSPARIAAANGLVLVYYQTNQYDKAKTLSLPDEATDERGNGNLLTFMKRFEGTPYRIAWPAGDRIAELPIINDFVPGGTLPEMNLEINGQTVRLLLDTGGDRLYVDEGVANKLGLKTISKRRSKYAYTKGEYVDEPLAVADQVKLGTVTVSAVPVIVAKWKALGQSTDGVITTQMLKQFLSTVDYDRKKIVLRERSAHGEAQLATALGASPIEMPFFMAGTHLMFAKGTVAGHDGLNLLLDSGLAAGVPFVILDETVKMLGLAKTPVPSSKFYLVDMSSHGLNGLVRGPAQALGNVIIEEDAYWTNGFLWDGLISHQYLRHLGSWTIDFDRMKYYFPRSAEAK
jgi:hypothetical protein